MVSGADVRVALEAGLWKALAGSGDRAAMRSSCRDAGTMADMLHDTAVLPVGPAAGTPGSAASIAAYHRRLGTVRTLHVRYGAGDAEAPHAVQFLQAYRAALGPALPATHCSIDVADGRQLPPPFAAVLLQRVVPRVERLDMALGSYRSLAQLLQALEPCTRLRALRLLPASSQHRLTVCERIMYEAHHGEPINLNQKTGVLDALCKLTCLHTLSGQWEIEHAHLKRLCDALPSLTTLGFQRLTLKGALDTCISRQLHTLAANGDAEGAGAACDGAEGAGAARIIGISAMASALPAVQQLQGVSLFRHFSTHADERAVRDAVQRFAACAHAWRLHVWPDRGAQLQHVAQRLPAGCLAPLQHLELSLGLFAPSAAGVAAMLGCLVSAAPNLATVKLVVRTAGMGLGCKDMVAMVSPLRQAAHLHTLRLGAYGYSSSEQQAALEGGVRCLAQRGAEGEGAQCRALQRVLLWNAPLHVLDACRRALGRDGIAVCVDTY